MTESDENRDKKDKKGRLIVISGFAGSGKGTVLKELFKLADYKYSISATTRTPRNGEVHGVDYYFLSKDEFVRKIYDGELLEYVEYSGNYYGTLKEPVVKTLENGYNVILEIEVVGALKIKENFPDVVMIFITPPTYAELEKRLRNRATESEEVIQRRLEISKSEINYMDRYDYFLINEDNRQKEVASAINDIVIHAESGDIIRYKCHGSNIKKFVDTYFSVCSEKNKS